MTYAEYQRTPEGHYNLIEGELFVTPGQTVRHQLVKGDLVMALWAWVERTRLGQVFMSALDVELRVEDPAIVVQPEIFYVAKGGRARVTERCVVGPPDLAIEVVSPSSLELDTVRKRAVYERYGVREYWLVHLDRDQAEVLTPGPDGRYGPPRIIDRHEVLASPILPGFALALDMVLAGDGPSSMVP